MRIFIGIKLDAAALDLMEKFLKPFKKMSTPIKWTTKENLHITLKFIGDTSPDQYKKIESLLMNTDFKMEPLEVTLSSCGKFGRDTELSIFWIGMDPNPILKALYERIEDTLSRAGIEKENRPFTPHITVGRNKRMFQFKSFFQMMEERNGQFIAACPIKSFQLFSSELTPEGPIYKVLKEIPIVAA